MKNLITVSGGASSSLVTLISTAIIAQGELDIVSHVHAPTLRVERRGVAPVGPEDANITIREE